MSKVNARAKANAKGSFKRFKKPFDKPKNVVQVEEVGTYSITINPQQQAFLLKSSKYVIELKRVADPERECINIHYLKFMTGLLKFFLRKIKGCQIQLVPEVSPLGRIHYHGFIYVYDIVEFRMYDVPRMLELGTIYIVPVDDCWLGYMYKDYHIMFPYCVEHNLKYATLYGCFGKPRKLLNPKLITELESIKLLAEIESLKAT